MKSPSGSVSSQSLRSRSTIACFEVGEAQHRTGEAEVGGDGAVEQERLLRYDDESGAQLVVGNRGQRHPAEAHDPDGRIGEAGDQAAERGLARARLADQGDLLPGRDLGGDVDEHRWLVVVASAAVAEGDVLDADAQRALRQRDRDASGSGGPIGFSNTPSTRRRPATAVCVWSSTSVNSAIGSRNR